MVFGVDALGFFKLVFEDDDAAGRLDGGALVDEFAGAGGDAQLIAGAAALSLLPLWQRRCRLPTRTLIFRSASPRARTVPRELHGRHR
ncbi:hypothetical protein A6A29_38115 [Streptomyces sp. TSRI0281]|nr:hypothetical protein A6A29_38115 [Streptomyces sp. TSRI0281]